MCGCGGRVFIQDRRKGLTMAVFGWLVLALGLGVISFFWLVLSFQWLGTYNIGGVPNSWRARLGYLLAGVFLGFLWAALMRAAPFSIALK